MHTPYIYIYTYIHTKKTRNTRTAINPRVEVESEQFHPINISNKILTDDEKSLLSKGPSFCPTPKDVNRLKLAEDWEIFESRLRSAVLFKQIRPEKGTPINESPQLLPKFKSKSTWRAPVSKSLPLENFLQLVKTDIFDPANTKKALDNLNKGERRALRDLQQLDSQSIKIQDKGSKFVILETEEYDSKMYKQLNNPLHYRKLDSDSSSNHFDVVASWCNKWHSYREPLSLYRLLS